MFKIKTFVNYRGHSKANFQDLIENNQHYCFQLFHEDTQIRGTE